MDQDLLGRDSDERSPVTWRRDLWRGRALAAALTPRGIGVAWVISRAAYAAGLVLAHAGSHRALLPTDVAVVYYDAASHLVHGGVPYLTFGYEYPPGTLPFLALAWALGGPSRVGFVVAWCLVMLALDGVVTWQLSRSRFAVSAGYLWVVGVCLLGPTLMLRNDLVVVASFVLAFGLSARRGTVSGGAVWMLAGLSKVWPFAPMAGLLLVRRPGRSRLIVGAALVLGGSVGLLLVNGALVAMIRYLFARQGQRPLEIETVWAMPVWLKALATHGQVAIVHTFGSENLVGAQAAATAATLAIAGIQVACVLAPVVIVRRTRAPITAELLGWIFATYVAAMLVAAPVASPQYAAWALGAACLLVGVTDRAEATRFAALTLIACALTQLIYPALYAGLEHADAEAIVALLLRNTVLVAGFVVGVIGVARATGRGRRLNWAGPRDEPKG